MRNIIIGRNSKVWTEIGLRKNELSGIWEAISHSDIKEFEFLEGDRIWILAYSMIAAENISMLDTLRSCDLNDFVYISSASTNVCDYTDCYRYPRLKREAANYAKKHLHAKILTIGLVVKDFEALPAGTTCATTVGLFFDFLNNYSSSHLGENETFLFEMIERSFKTKFEENLYNLYGTMQNFSLSFPCLLRPIDLALKLMGYRWYGYLYMSNRLWNTTIL